MELSSELHGADAVAKRDKYPNYFSMFQTETEWEFFEPVRVGDTIDAEARLADLYWKQGRKHRLLFVVSEVTFTNQKKQLLGTNRSSCVFMFK